MSEAKISEAAAYQGRGNRDGVTGNWHAISEAEYKHHTVHRTNGYEVRALYDHPQPAELAEQQGVELPPLPASRGFIQWHSPQAINQAHGFTANQMQDYARAAFAAGANAASTGAVFVNMGDSEAEFIRMGNDESALAAIGKQQGGEVESLPPEMRPSDPEYLNYLDGPKHVGEVPLTTQLARAQVKIAALELQLHLSTAGQVPGVDVGLLRELAESWQVVADPDPTPLMQAHQHANHCCADELLALIDSQRDAAPGV